MLNLLSVLQLVCVDVLFMILMASLMEYFQGSKAEKKVYRYSWRNRGLVLLDGLSFVVLMPLSLILTICRVRVQGRDAIFLSEQTRWKQCLERQVKREVDLSDRRRQRSWDRKYKDCFR